MANKQRIGLALSAGGARGIVHAKVLEVFDELGVKPDFIVGSSVGAIIGTLYASGLSGKELTDICSKLSKKKWYKFFDLAFDSSGLVRGNGVRDILKPYLDSVNIEELSIKTAIIATDFWKEKEVVFTKGNVIDALRASSSVPGIFIPYTNGNQVLVDGAVVNPLPSNVAKKHADIVIAIDITHENPAKKNPKDKPTIFEMLSSSFQMLQEETVVYKMKAHPPDLYFAFKSAASVRAMDAKKMHTVPKLIEKDLAKFKAELKKLLKEKGVM